MLANGVGHPYVCCDTTLVVGTVYELRGIKHLIHLKPRIGLIFAGGFIFMHSLCYCVHG